MSLAPKIALRMKGSAFGVAARGSLTAGVLSAGAGVSVVATLARCPDDRRDASACGGELLTDAGTPDDALRLVNDRADASIAGGTTGGGAAATADLMDDAALRKVVDDDMVLWDSVDWSSVTSGTPTSSSATIMLFMRRSMERDCCFSPKPRPKVVFFVLVGDDGIHGIFTLIVGNFCEAVAGPKGLSPGGGGDDASTGTVPSPDMLFALCKGDAAPGLPWPPPPPPGLKGLPAMPDNADKRRGSAAVPANADVRRGNIPFIDTARVIVPIAECRRRPGEWVNPNKATNCALRLRVSRRRTLPKYA